MSPGLEDLLPRPHVVVEADHAGLLVGVGNERLRGVVLVDNKRGEVLALAVLARKDL